MAHYVIQKATKAFPPWSGPELIDPSEAQPGPAWCIKSKDGDVRTRGPDLRRLFTVIPETDNLLGACPHVPATRAITPGLVVIK